MGDAVGDTVYGSFGRYGSIDVRQGIVTKVSPTGQLSVDFSERNSGDQKPFLRRFKGGHEIGGDKWHGVVLIDYERYARLSAEQSRIAARNTIRDAASNLARTMPVDKAELRAQANELLAMIDRLP